MCDHCNISTHGRFSLVLWKLGEKKKKKKPGYAARTENCRFRSLSCWPWIFVFVPECSSIVVVVSWRPYPVTVEQLDGSEDVKLASHEELDGQFPGQRRHSMLTGPLVDFLQKLPGSLKHTQMLSENSAVPKSEGQAGRKWNWGFELDTSSKEVLSTAPEIIWCNVMACCSGGYAAVYPWEWSKECSNKQKEDEVNIYTKMNTKVEWHMQMDTCTLRGDICCSK